MCDEMSVRIVCPYCGRSQIHKLEMSQYYKREVILCYPEEGGCDRYFVVEHKVNPSYKTYKMVEN